jgi:hypothetical protein
MKRKVKKYAGEEGSLVKGTTNLRTRSDAEFDEDSKFGGYGRYMPKSGSLTRGIKSTASEDRPTTSGVEDYESLGKRAPAKSTWSGETEIKEEKNEKTDDYESDSVAGKGAENLASESDKDKESKPAKKTAKKKIEPKKSKSYEDTGAKIGSQDFKMKPSVPEKISGMGPKNTFLTKERMGVKDTSTGSFMDRIKEHLGNEFKTKKMASGGKVSSASSRGDGIAQRGKTKGRMC